MADDTKPMRQCRLHTLVNQISDLQLVQQLFISEGLNNPMNVFQRKKKSIHLYDFISWPQIYQSVDESYYYALCLKQNDNNIIHAPVHLLIIDDKDVEYENYLRSQTQQHPEICDALFIVYDYLKKMYNNKPTKTKKKKYIKKGQKIAHDRVFKQILLDIGQKIYKNLRFQIYQTAQNSNKEHGQHHTLCIGFDKNTWYISGYDILKTYCDNMQQDGGYTYFWNINDEIKLFNRKLEKIKDKKTKERYTATHIKFGVNTIDYKITAWYDIDYIDKKGLPHAERL